ncbi:MAG: hypothetical protein ACO1RX_10535 [Candidatus Sericytochromatia bacterium]
MLKHAMLATVGLSLLLSTQAPPAQAQNMTGLQLIDQIIKRSEKTGFTGKRKMIVYRGRPGEENKAYTATADITYADRNNYNIHILSPAEIKGIRFDMVKGVNSAYFPDEKLYLYNGGANTSYMPERIILNQFVPRKDLIEDNYEIKLEEKTDVISLKPAYVLDLIPKNTFKDSKGNAQWVAARRKYWVDKESFYILREDRFWGFEQPYSISTYDIFKDTPTKPQVTAITPPAGTTQVNLSGQQNNSFLTYSTVEQAEAKEGIRISLPTYLPKGFVFKDVQVFTLFGARIQVMNFTDGVNDLMVTVRPQQNAFVTLLAGAFSLNLIKKITDLSHQAPNNYWPVNSPNRVGVAFGDVNPDELQRVTSSLSL